MKFFSGWMGLGLFTVGVLSMIFRSELPEGSKIPAFLSLVLVFSGVVFMYYGRRYLPAWLGQLFGRDDATDD